ncbi:MAG: nucleotidyltransferase family protein [Candidatus Binatia bacterium]
MSRFPRKAMVLAAGRGVRLKPLTDRLPKALVEVAGRPMIEYPLRMLAAAGVEEVVVNLHHRGELIRATLGNGDRFGVRIHYSTEDSLLDTGGAVARARPLLEGAPFAIANCDALLDVDLSALWEFHRRRSALATLVVRSDPQAERYGAIDVDIEGRVRRFLGKPAATTLSLARRMFCGVQVISPEIFELMPTAPPAFSITSDVYARAFADGRPLYGFDYAGYWRDLGTAESLAAAEADAMAKRFAPAYLDRSVEGQRK